MQPYLIVIIVIAAAFALLFLLAAVSELTVFGKRCDKNPLLRYFTAEDFSLSAERVELSCGLKGFIYRKSGVAQLSKVIIFCHGMGPGHIAYTTEIANFCNLGYTVLAVDSKGCNFSGGKSIGGMYSGVKTVVAAIDFARAKFGQYGVYLVGHSWGAYSALCAAACRKVDAVVAISSPVTPVKTALHAAASVISLPVAAILSPFWWLTNFLRYGVKGNSDAARCAVKCGVPVMLVHGDKDPIVPLPKSVFGKAEGDNITKLKVSGRGHNPYNTENAEKRLAELLSQLKSGVKDFSQFDFSSATEEDESVMGKIAQFISQN